MSDEMIYRDGVGYIPYHAHVRLMVVKDEQLATLRATNERLLKALAARPIKPRHHPEKLRKLTGEDGYHKGWQEALTALGNARAALAEEKPND
jgi:hypothetical protein